MPTKTVLLASSLLHDLGHGPFSHVFERVSGIEHEKLTQRLIADPESDVHQILAAHDRALPDLVIRFCGASRSVRFSTTSSPANSTRIASITSSATT